MKQKKLSNPLGERSAKLSSLLAKMDELPKLSVDELRPFVRVLANVADDYYMLEQVPQLAQAIFDKTDDVQKSQAARIIMEALAVGYHGDKTSAALGFVKTAPLMQKLEVAQGCGLAMLKCKEICFEGTFADKLRKQNLLSPTACDQYKASIKEYQTYSPALNLDRAIAGAFEMFDFIA